MPSLALDMSFLRNRKTLRIIAVATATCAGIGGLYGLFGPKWYRSTVIFAPATPQKPSLSGMLGGAVGPLGSLASGLDLTAADTQRISAVLQSATVTDKVAEQLGLRVRYDLKSPEEVREAVWKHCAVSPMPKPSLVQLSCEDRDPAFAQEMLRQFAEWGNKTFQQVNVGSATEEVKFLEAHVARLRREADEAADKYREFQERHQIVDLESQAKALVSSMAALNAQQISKEIELKYAQAYTSQDEASTRQLRSQLDVVEMQLRDLEMPRNPSDAAPGSKAGAKGPKGFFPATQAVPRLRAELEALYRDRKVAEATLMFALERLTNARATQAREASTLVVLDPPTLPTRKSRPRALDSTLVGALVGFAGMLIAVGVRANRYNLKKFIADATTP
jgi:capsule polysaccharide export protein KpsE/RkpR